MQMIAAEKNTGGVTLGPADTYKNLFFGERLF
jgi:hypothetical protein